MTDPASAGVSGGPRVETPSAKIVRDANEVHYNEKRTIGIKRPDILAQFRFIEALGPEITKNDAWVNMMLPVLYIAEIEGIAQRAPMTKREAEAMVQKLGNDGYVQLGRLIAEKFADDAEAANGGAPLKNS